MTDGHAAFFLPHKPPADDVRCSICGAKRPALILDGETPLSEAIVEALAAGRAVLPKRYIPDPRPTWVCQQCGAWVYFDGVDNQSLYAI